MGKSRQDAKEEKRQEIMFFQNLLTKLQNNRKIHQHLRNITKFDIPSLRSVGRTIDAMVERKLTFEDPFLRNFIMTPTEREEYDRKKNEERQRRMNEERQRLEEIKQKKVETAERIKKEKQESFEKLKGDLLAQVAREPYKISPVFNFVEPIPNCHYDIGPSFGHVVIPIPQDYQQITEEMEIEAHEGHGNEFMDEIREEGRREVQLKGSKNPSLEIPMI